MVDVGPVAPRAPPASKEVVANLPVITLTEEILANLGKDAECAICRENLVLNDKMQELPCKHTFHPPCLKPWLVLSLTPQIYWKFYVLLLKSTSCILFYGILLRNDMIRYKVCSILSFMWQDEHNSCPICRHELQTDDHAYESWKEREKEAEEERKGAENAIRGGEYMYV